MAISVKLNVFEGPLDLLLHLIDKNKIDIYDIPIVEITDQYMEYLHSMEKEDLERISGYGGDTSGYQVQDASSKRDQRRRRRGRSESRTGAETSGV